MGAVYAITEPDFLLWIDKLAIHFDVHAPIVAGKGQHAFAKIAQSSDMAFDYCNPMASPRNLIYPAKQNLAKLIRSTGQYDSMAEKQNRQVLIIGMRPCDLAAVEVLDKVFLNFKVDPQYQRNRKNTLIAVMNCSRACVNGFCPSMGTGPFNRQHSGYDIEITPVKGMYLLEFASARGEEIGKFGEMHECQHGQAMKADEEQRAISMFTKSIDTAGLPELLLANLEHPVFKYTADARCLNCTNCTMVCPTCFCYDVKDETAFDAETVIRKRQWGSCQDLFFAQVNVGNFRSSRKARLRQFVTHKLSTWVEQFGCFGCIGCGRCMTWCPTSIDLTEMAKVIQRDQAEAI